MKKGVMLYLDVDVYEEFHAFYGKESSRRIEVMMCNHLAQVKRGKKEKAICTCDVPLIENYVSGESVGEPRKVAVWKKTCTKCGQVTIWRTDNVLMKVME